MQSFCCALSDTATEVLALGCPHLSVLRLSFCGSAVSDSSLRSIGLHLLELRELSVRGCVRVTGLGVEAVVEGCHNLAVFDVSQCKNLARWLEEGGVDRCRKGWKRDIRFEVVAGDGVSPPLPRPQHASAAPNGTQSQRPSPSPMMGLNVNMSMSTGTRTGMGMGLSKGMSMGMNKGLSMKSP